MSGIIIRRNDSINRV